ncbi:MAG: ABC transporter ATP-binding protein [Chloroflexota bacterium]
MLEVRGLTSTFRGGGRPLRAIDHVDIELGEGEVLCLVGESGSGKSVTALSIMRLIELETGDTVEGQVRLKGEDLLTLTQSDMRRIRGRGMAMIFQEPMTAFNPVLTIGAQLEQAVTYHVPGPSRRRHRPEARRRALDTLRAVGIADTELVMRRYPHQLSGGMRQRAMIAMALMGNPALLIADEPTTALDVTIQAQVLELLQRLVQQSNMGVILVSHDMGVAAEMADRVAVMYAGQIVENGPAGLVLSNPRHPYTMGLLASVPRLDGARRTRLVTIGGSVPRLDQMPGGCRFQPRCGFATEKCRETPDLIALDGRLVRCWHAERIRAEGGFGAVRLGTAAGA